MKLLSLIYHENLKLLSLILLVIVILLVTGLLLVISYCNNPGEIEDFEANLHCSWLFYLL